MTSRCPWQDKRNLKKETLACPDCGYEVELFSDEYKVSCPSCKGQVKRKKPQSCADWCSRAAECSGK